MLPQYFDLKKRGRGHGENFQIIKDEAELGDVRE
jgi:hypothetical protein